MKALNVFENIDFKRGMSSKEALGLGGLTAQICYNLKKRGKYRNLSVEFEGDNITVRASNVPLIYNNMEGNEMEARVEVSQDIKILEDPTGKDFSGKPYANIENRIASIENDTWVEGDDGTDPNIHGSSPQGISSYIEFSLDDIEESFIEELNEKEDLNYLESQEW